MWYNTIMVWLLNSPLHGMLSGNMMVLSITGHKSGKIYQVPVGYLRVDETLVTISNKNRKWRRNLRGGAPVTIRFQGNEIKGHAEVVEDMTGVVKGLKDFIGVHLQSAHMIGVELDPDGQANEESLRQAAIDRVVVRTTLR